MQITVETVAGGSQAAVHPVGRIALLIRSVKSAFAFTFEKSNKTPARAGLSHRKERII